MGETDNETFAYKGQIFLDRKEKEKILFFFRILVINCKALLRHFLAGESRLDKKVLKTKRKGEKIRCSFVYKKRLF